MARYLRDNLDEKIAGGCGLVFFAIIAAGAVGWCMNIYKLAVALSEPLTLLLVLRALGIVFPPLGAVVGYV